MAEENKQPQAGGQTASGQMNVPIAEAKAVSRIPMTSIAVMIFILLVAVFCIGLQVVTGMVEQKNPPIEIKGKSATQQVEYPMLGELPRGIAAEVNGVEIPESQINDYVAKMREGLGLEDQEAWDEWLVEGDNTTEELRDQVILYYVNNEVIDQLAQEMGIDPTQEEIDAFREQWFSNPERLEAIQVLLNSQGLTFDDYEQDVIVLTKRNMIMQAALADLMATSDFKDGVLSVIKDRNAEYANVESLDEVDPALVDAVTAELAELNEENAFSQRAHDFLEKSEILYSEMPNDLPYKSAADTHRMKQEFKQMLNKNGVFLGEGGIFDNLMANSGDADES